jgi:hypothetical protein
MLRMNRAASFVCVVALVAGCGSDGGGSSLTKTEYETAVTDALGAAGADADEVAPPDDASRSVQADAFDDTADVVDKTATDLDDLEPPADIADEHQGFVEFLHGIADEYRDFADQLRSGDAPTLKQYVKTQEPLLTPSPELVAKSDAFRQAAADGGYDFGDAITVP